MIVRYFAFVDPIFYFLLFAFYFTYLFIYFWQESKILKFLGFMWNPLSWVMEAAAIMAIVLANGGVSIEYCYSNYIFKICFRKKNGVFYLMFLEMKIYLSHFVSNILLLGISLLQGKPPEWQDFIGITTLLLINSTVCYVLENNADAASAALMAHLAPQAKVLTALE